MKPSLTRWLASAPDRARAALERLRELLGGQVAAPLEEVAES